MSAIDDLLTTDAERACLAKLRELVGAADGPIERHSVRVFVIAEKLAHERGNQSVDREVLLCASLLHDAGLYPGAATKRAYVSDGRALALELLAGHGWSADRLRLCGNAIERHHEPRNQWRRGVEVELVRRADLVEVSQTLINFGLSRAWLKDLRARIAVKGFAGEVARLLAVAARDRPSSMPRIWHPGG